MAKDYHPLDVRYKGPSTAYRGSSKRDISRDRGKKPGPRKAPLANPSQPKQSAPKAQAMRPQSGEVSPWGNRYRSDTPPATPQRTTAATATTRGIGGAFKVFTGVINTVKYTYFALLALIFLLAFIF